MRLDKARFTIFDFETTGLSAQCGDRICEIGALKVDASGKKVGQFHSLVDPQRPISYGAFLVNKISEDMLRGKPTIDELLPDFMDFIDGSVLVAYNACFDLGFLESALGPAAAPALNDYTVIDCLSLARRLFPGFSRYSLGAVARQLDIRVGREHRAMADVLLTFEIFQRELNILRDGGAREVKDLIAAQARGPAYVKKETDVTVVFERAIKARKEVIITYRSLWNSQSSSRVITPKKLHKFYDKSYVIAYCHLRNEERTFRLDCILDAHLQ
jgi:DNA polymerase III subunit epsilon